MAVTAEVFIDGEIGSYYYGASVAGIREQLQYRGQFEEIRCVINSCGGDIAEGLGIFDLLRSYGVPITTVVIGQCCSAATIVFLAGSTRLIYENVVAFMVHQASGGGEGTAEQLRTIADFIDAYNDRMKTIYMEVTKATADKVAEWMSTDTFMTAEEAVTNGFATMIAKPVQAVYKVTAPTASSQSNQNSDIMKIIVDSAQRLFTKIKALGEGKTVVAKKVKTDAGVELEISTVDGGDLYDENDEVKIDGKPAEDGTHKIGEVTIVLEGGKIKTLTSEVSKDVEGSATTETPATETPATETPAPAESADVTAMRQELADLRTKYAAQEATNNQLVTAVNKVTALLGNKISQDVAIPVGGQVRQDRTTVTAQAQATDEEVERQAMLDKRKQRGQDAPATA